MVNNLASTVGIHMINGAVDTVMSDIASTMPREPTNDEYSKKKHK